MDAKTVDLPEHDELNQHEHDAPEPSQAERELQALKAKNGELLSDLAKLKQIRKTIDELGGLEQIKEIVLTKKEAARKQVEESGDVQAIKRQYQEEVSTLQQQLQQLRQEQLNSKVDEKLRSVVESQGGVWELVAPAIKKQIHADMDGGQLNIEVLDNTGHIWVKEGRDATVEDLLEKLKGDPVYSRAFANDNRQPLRTGSGAANSRRKPETNPWLKDNFSLQEQTRVWLDNPTKARRMMEEAGVEVARRR
jgi:prefoldin subunit 5